MAGLPTILQLKQGDTLLATLTVFELMDLFWLGYKFEPTEAFADVEPHFLAATASLGDDDIRRVLRRT